MVSGRKFWPFLAAAVVGRGKGGQAPEGGLMLGVFQLTFGLRSDNAQQPLRGAADFLIALGAAKKRENRAEGGQKTKM